MAKQGRAAAVDEVTYPLGAVTRLTGLSEHVIRAWERRYGAVEPVRTPGGTRRYREEDVERLRLLAAVVAAGHSIGDVARLEDEQLRGRLQAGPSPASPALPGAIDAIARLDAAGAEHLISSQLSALGPARFAREFALPLLEEIGEGWMRERICVASEHMASAILRSLLGSALRPTPGSAGAPPVIFAAPAGDRHELGILIAALTAQAAGGNPVFLGADLPEEELVHAAEAIGAAALVLGITVTNGRDTPGRDTPKQLRSLRAALPDEVELWVGGAASRDLELPAGVQGVADLDQLERKISLLGVRRRS